jgi:hypothetical protein
VVNERFVLILNGIHISEHLVTTQFVAFGICGVRWQTECDTAIRVARQAGGAKSPSPLRSAGALHMVAVSRYTPGLLTPL